MADDTPIRDLTDDELYAEWHRWDDKIKNATGWGGALTAAAEFRKAVERELVRRGLTVPE